MDKNKQLGNFVSIVYLNYRRGACDRDTISKLSLASLLENTTYPYELIFVDNTQNNRGFSNGRNFGASLATGKYIAFVDDDILFLPLWLETCIGLVEKGDKYMATPVIQRLIARWELPGVDGVRQNYRTGSNCMVMRRSAFDEIGEFWNFRRGIQYTVAKAGKEYANRITRAGYTFLICNPARATDLGVNKHSYA
jgi:glycosyltransferase involved in cell wall biosynthesis